MAVIQLPAMPQWLIEAASGKPRSKPQTPSTAKASTTSVGTTRYGSAAVDRELTALKSTEEGARNDQLNRSAHALAQLSAGGEIDGDVAKSLLRQAAHEIELEAYEIERTLDSAWAAGSRQPRGPISRAMAVAKTPAIINARELSKNPF